MSCLSTKPNIYKVAVITASDKGFAGCREDVSGALIREIMHESGYRVEECLLLPDERELLSTAMRRLCDETKVNLIITTGGTGLSPRDCTPEATLAIAERFVPGISEAIRMESLKITGRAMLSRGISVIRGSTLIINLPGSPKAVQESLQIILPQLEHALDILSGTKGECARQ